MSRLFLFCLIACLPLTTTLGQESKKKADDPTENHTRKDSGKEKIGQIKATLYIGTNNDVKKLGLKAGTFAPADTATIKQLQGINQLKFKHYRQLGEDTQSVFRSYENWLSPLKPSEEILLSFESRGRSSDGGLRLDLEFWQQRRKVMKSDPILYLGKPLLILGPKWRGGTLIIAVELLKNS